MFCSVEDIFIMTKIRKFSEKIKYFLTLYYFVVVISSFLTVHIEIFSVVIKIEYLRQNYCAISKWGYGDFKIMNNGGLKKFDY